MSIRRATTVGDTGAYPFDFERSDGWRHVAKLPHESARIWLEEHRDPLVRERAHEVVSGNKNYVVVAVTPTGVDTSLVVALYRHDFSTWVIEREHSFR